MTTRNIFQFPMSTNLATSEQNLACTEGPNENSLNYSNLAPPVFPMDSWYLYQVQSLLGLRDIPSEALVHSVLLHVSLGHTGLPRGELL